MNFIQVCKGRKKIGEKEKMNLIRLKKDNKILLYKSKGNP